MHLVLKNTQNREQIRNHSNHYIFRTFLIQPQSFLTMEKGEDDICNLEAYFGSINNHLQNFIFLHKNPIGFHIEKAIAKENTNN